MDDHAATLEAAIQWCIDNNVSVHFWKGRVHIISPEGDELEAATFLDVIEMAQNATPSR